MALQSKSYGCFLSDHEKHLAAANSFKLDRMTSFVPKKHVFFYLSRPSNLRKQVLFFWRQPQRPTEIVPIPHVGVRIDGFKAAETMPLGPFFSAQGAS